MTAQYEKQINISSLNILFNRPSNALPRQWYLLAIYFKLISHSAFRDYISDVKTD